MSGPWDDFTLTPSSSPWGDFTAPTAPTIEEPSMVKKAVSTVTENPYVQQAGTMAKKAALPMAGSTGGMYLGGLAGGPPGAIIGESLGGGIGEGVNQILGINEPSLAEIGMAMAAGPVVRGVVGGLKTVGSAALKASGGRQVIADIAEGISKKLFNPVVSSEDLFAEVASKSGVQVPTIKTGNAIAAAIKGEATNPDTPIKAEIVAILDPLKHFYQPMSGVASTRGAAELAADAKRFRFMASKAYKEGNSDLGNALSHVRNAIFDDAEAVGAPELRAAVKAYRKEAAVEELQGVLRQANPMKAYKDLQVKNALFGNVFSDAEQKQIDNLLKQMSTVTPSGFSGVAGRMLSTLGGEHVGGKVGAIVGFIAPEMAAGVLSTSAGRKVMEKLLVGNTWDAPKAAALAQFWRAQKAKDAQDGQLAADVKAALRNPLFSIDDKISQAQLRAAFIGAGQGGADPIEDKLKMDVERRQRPTNPYYSK